MTPGEYTMIKRASVSRCKDETVILVDRTGAQTFLVLASAMLLQHAEGRFGNRYRPPTALGLGFRESPPVAINPGEHSLDSKLPVVQVTPFQTQCLARP